MKQKNQMYDFYNILLIFQCAMQLNPVHMFKWKK